MREILFRGQTRKYGEKVMIGTGKKLPGQWVYGGIFPGEGDYSVIYGYENGAKHTISNLKKFVVYTDTVGEYIGLNDCEGEKIFEGDIVSAKDEAGREVYRFVVEHGVRGGTRNVKHPVGYPCFYFREVSLAITYEFMPREDPLYFLNAYRCEVICNIHDNPELIG